MRTGSIARAIKPIVELNPYCREPNGREHVGSADRNDIMESQKLAVDTIVYATGCDRAEVTAFIARHYLDGLKDAKRLTFKGDAILQEPAF